MASVKDVAVHLRFAFFQCLGEMADSYILINLLHEIRRSMAAPGSLFLGADAEPVSSMAVWEFPEVVGQPFVLPPEGSGLGEDTREDLGIRQCGVGGLQATQAESADEMITCRRDA